MLKKGKASQEEAGEGRAEVLSVFHQEEEKVAAGVGP